MPEVISEQSEIDLSELAGLMSEPDKPTKQAKQQTKQTSEASKQVDNLFLSAVQMSSDDSDDQIKSDWFD